MAATGMDSGAASSGTSRPWTFVPNAVGATPTGRPAATVPARGVQQGARMLHVPAFRTTRIGARRAALAALAVLAACTPATPASRPVATSPSDTAATRAEVPRAPTPSRAAPVAKTLEFAILEDYDKGDDLAGVARDFRAFRELGITTWRGSFGWDDYEPSEGRFDFAWLHRFATLADTMGIRLRPYLGYTPRWAAVGRTADSAIWNDPPRRPEAFARYAGALAAEMRRHRSIVSYEIYNEENVKLWWDGTAEEYAAVLALGADAVRRGHPGVQVLLGGVVWPDAEWIETSCGNGNAARIDVVPLHSYAETWTPDSVTIETYFDATYRGPFLSAVDEACGGKPVWINETGFATWRGKTEKEQAAWWARALAVFAAEPRVTQVGVYEIRDLRPSSDVIGDAANYHLGLLRVDRAPKLAFATVKLLVRLLGGPLTVRDGDLAVTPTGVALTDSADVHAFERADGGQVVIAWIRRGRAARTVSISLPGPGSRATAYALDGTATPVPDFEGRTLRDVRLDRGEVRIFEIAPAAR